MNNLVRIIGKAPTELSYEELRTKLLVERQRVRRGFDYFRNVIARKKGKRGGSKKASSGSNQLTSAFQELGLSPAQVLKGLELLKAQKKGGN